MKTTGVLLAIACSMLAACGDPNARRVRSIQDWYVEHSDGCDPAAVTTTESRPGIFEARGCEVPENYHTYCHPGGYCEYVPESRVLERASFDMSCPAEQLELRTLELGQVGVSGCDGQGVYVLTHTGWVLNGGR